MLNFWKHNFRIPRNDKWQALPLWWKIKHKYKLSALKKCFQNYSKSTLTDKLIKTNHRERRYQWIGQSIWKLDIAEVRILPQISQPRKKVKSRPQVQGLEETKQARKLLGDMVHQSKETKQERKRQDPGHGTHYRRKQRKTWGDVGGMLWDGVLRSEQRTVARGQTGRPGQYWQTVWACIQTYGVWRNPRMNIWDQGNRQQAMTVPKAEATVRIRKHNGRTCNHKQNWVLL